MYEPGGMVMYLADRYPYSNLDPAVSEPEPYLYNQWLFYLPFQMYQTYPRCYNSAKFSPEQADGGIIRDLGAKILENY
ncbi:MAG: hypothetical protein O4749_02675 [Trichodesmium sp. St5_bin2_1]|nr:hypothetical protein [Trichodesmium sp. St5_bin2_1]MDE5112403.1 hypothetical protein [Trichodesmium sp. St7_bin2_1]